MQGTSWQTVHEEDWVKGTSLDDERIRGFVEAVSPDGLTAKVHVVESDHPEAVGRSVLSKTSRLEPLPHDLLQDRESLASLIDLALDTGDREWFAELTAHLQAQDVVHPQPPVTTGPVRRPVNRIQA